MKKQTQFSSPKALVTKQAAYRLVYQEEIHVRGGRQGQWRCALLVMAALGSFLADASVKGVFVTDTFYGMGALANVTTGIVDSAFGYDALNADTTGDGNTASGVYALLLPAPTTQPPGLSRSVARSLSV